MTPSLGHESTPVEHPAAFVREHWETARTSRSRLHLFCDVGQFGYFCFVPPQATHVTGRRKRNRERKEEYAFLA